MPPAVDLEELDYATVWSASFIQCRGTIDYDSAAPGVIGPIGKSAVCHSVNCGGMEWTVSVGCLSLKSEVACDESGADRLSTIVDLLDLVVS